MAQDTELSSVGNGRSVAGLASRPIAKAWLHLYISDRDFLAARELLGGNSYYAFDSLLTAQIYGFLNSHGVETSVVSQIPDLESIIEKVPIDTVSLIGETLHFVSTTITNYVDHGQPAQLIENTFDALRHTEKDYTTRFLGKLTELVNDERTRTAAAYAMETLLPYLIAKQSSDRDYTKRLDAVIAYIKTSTPEISGQVLIGDFEGYLARAGNGHQKPNDNRTSDKATSNGNGYVISDRILEVLQDDKPTRLRNANALKLLKSYSEVPILGFNLDGRSHHPSPQLAIIVDGGKRVVVRLDEKSTSLFQRLKKIGSQIPVNQSTAPYRDMTAASLKAMNMYAS